MDLREIYKTDHGDLSGLDILLLEENRDDAESFKKRIETKLSHHVGRHSFKKRF